MRRPSSFERLRQLSQSLSRWIPLLGITIIGTIVFRYRPLPMNFAEALLLGSIWIWVTLVIGFLGGYHNGKVTAFTGMIEGVYSSRLGRAAQRRHGSGRWGLIDPSPPFVPCPPSIRTFIHCIPRATILSAQTWLLLPPTVAVGASWWVGGQGQRGLLGDFLFALIWSFVAVAIGSRLGYRKAEEAGEARKVVVGEVELETYREGVHYLGKYPASVEEIKAHIEDENEQFRRKQQIILKKYMKLEELANRNRVLLISCFVGAMILFLLSPWVVKV